MSGRFGELVIGWVFAICAALLIVAMIARAISGHSEGWYEWPVILAMSALFLLIGIANLLLERPHWLVAMVVGGYGAFVFGVGVAALLAPDAMTVTSGRGPRTAGWARVVGVAMACTGSAMLVGVWRSRRRNTPPVAGR